MSEGQDRCRRVGVSAYRRVGVWANRAPQAVGPRFILTFEKLAPEQLPGLYADTPTRPYADTPIPPARAFG